MHESLKEGRYVYLKARDVVNELEVLSEMHPKLPDCGPEAYVAHFLRVTNGYPTLLISLDRNTQEYRKQIGHAYEAHAFSWRSAYSFKTLYSRIITSLKVLRIALSFKPTHMLVWHNGLPLWISFLVAKLNKSVFISSRHNRLPQDNEPWHRRLAGTVTKWVLLRSNGIVCHGPYLKAEMLDIGVSSLKVFEFNWSYQYLLDALESGNEENVGSGKPFIVLFVGRIVGSKGVFDLLNACSELFKQYENMKLVYAGSGSDIQLLKDRVQKLELNAKVDILGHIRHDKLSKIIINSTVVVTPTQSNFPEGRCMATIEALVLGVPAIVPDFGPFTYLVKDRENGLRYQADNADALKRCIEEMIKDDHLVNKLKKGAKRTGKELVNPLNVFEDTVYKAFQTT